MAADDVASVAELSAAFSMLAVDEVAAEGDESSAEGTWLDDTSDEDVLKTWVEVLVTADGIVWAEVTIVTEETWAIVEAGAAGAEESTRDDEEAVEEDGFADKEGVGDADVVPVEDRGAREAVEDTWSRLLATDETEVKGGKDEVAEDSANGGAVELLKEWTWLLDIDDTINSGQGTW